MSRQRAIEPIPVELGPCECPDAPHKDGDVAYLRPRLTPEGGMRATYLMQTATDEEATYAALGMTFLVDGILSWTLLDDAGEPIPCTESVYRGGTIDWETTLAPIAERGFTLYTDSVMAPLRKGRKAPLQDGQTEELTSPTNDSSSPSPTPSEPSTTPTTPPSRPITSRTGIDSSI